MPIGIQLPSIAFIFVILWISVEFVSGYWVISSSCFKNDLKKN